MRLFYLALLCFACVRLYFLLTDGFSLHNITKEMVFEPRYESRPFSSEEKEKVRAILNQPFSYLGKGCQSYAFLSEDEQYVVKFFKLKRYRKCWFDYIHARKERLLEKERELDELFLSWKTAFDHLEKESEILYIHLNPTNDLQQMLHITDKMGFSHSIDLDNTIFMVQRKAELICPYLDSLMKKGEVERAKQVVLCLFNLVLSEYEMGMVDNDPALMQNTGVIDGKPIPIDLGLFRFNESVKDREVVAKKMHEFGLWLNKYPELAETYREQATLL